MRRYEIRFRPEAMADLTSIRRYIAVQTSPQQSERYIARLRTFVEGLRTFPERGSVREDIRPGLRIIGFERRIAIAFLVDGDTVVVFRALYGGKTVDPDAFR